MRTYYGDDEPLGEGECTCRRIGRGSNDPDGGWRIDRWCPYHGIDPDAAREAQRDDR